MGHKRLTKDDKKKIENEIRQGLSLNSADSARTRESRNFSQNNPETTPGIGFMVLLRENAELHEESVGHLWKI